MLWLWLTTNLRLSALPDKQPQQEEIQFSHSDKTKDTASTRDVKVQIQTINSKKHS